MPLATRKAKPDRNRIDLSDEAVARRWAKKLGKSRDEIAAAIAKVGDNCESVRKELGVKEQVCAVPVKAPVTKLPA
ncbi:MAG TPA: DUF3606 domain-containing protein [Pseudolabrys sp.]